MGFNFKTISFFNLKIFLKMFKFFLGNVFACAFKKTPGGNEKVEKN